MPRKTTRRPFIPATMATQHPDNAFPPFWERDGDGYISVHEELNECLSCYRDLSIPEFMWDWEGKHADEAVIDKLFSNHYAFFQKQHIGKDRFLTFRLPNIWQEKGYSLLRALMVILTSEDFARDLKFHSPPLFEVILPMTERADQLMYIQECFRKLSRFKSENFNHAKVRNTEVIEIIPLVESVESQVGIRTLLEEYVALYKRQFGGTPAYIRTFLARSDPALVSGLMATVLSNKVALSDVYEFSRRHKIPVYPIIGTGSLVFRGGLSPDRIEQFTEEYGGVRTVTIQSAFRYDYPVSKVKRAIGELERILPKTRPVHVDEHDRALVLSVVGKAGALYQDTVQHLTADLAPFFAAVPRRRERHQHIGLISYGRKMGKHPLPRAINFTAACYSLGVPPEFIGFGRALASLSERERQVLMKYYVNLKGDLIAAGKYINRDNLRALAKDTPAWNLIVEDIEHIERILGIKLGPKSQNDLLHHNLTTSLFLQRNKKTAVSKLIVKTGRLRRSLG